MIRMHVGSELERLRQSRGLSLEEVARRTKISVERLEAIERFDVDQLPPLTYLRGFLRAYATEVGLDPDDVASRYLAQVDEFSALAEFAAEPAGAEPPNAEPAALARSDAGITAPLPAASSEKAMPPWRPAQFVSPARGREAADAPLSGSVRQVADNYAEPAPVMPSRPGVASGNKRSTPHFRFTWALIAAAAAVTAGLALSASLNRVQEFWGRPASVATSANPAEVTPNEPRDAAPAVAGSHDAGGATADRATLADDSTIDDISGAWSLTTRVESTKAEAFKGLALGYQLQLEQQGNRVTGAGHKTTENGRSIASRSRTPINVEGTLNGRQLTLRFTERGARRTSGGTFTMTVADDGSMRGRFSSDAAASGGTAQAIRAPH